MQPASSVVYCHAHAVDDASAPVTLLLLLLLLL